MNYQISLKKTCILKCWLIFINISIKTELSAPRKWWVLVILKIIHNFRRQSTISWIKIMKGFMWFPRSWNIFFIIIELSLKTCIFKWSFGSIIDPSYEVDFEVFVPKINLYTFNFEFSKLFLVFFTLFISIP